MFEGPFVVLAQIRPLQSWYNIVVNLVQHLHLHQHSPTTGWVIDFVDQTDSLLEYCVLPNLDIPPPYDQVGQGGAPLHPL